VSETWPIKVKENEGIMFESLIPIMVDMVPLTNYVIFNYVIRFVKK
jgi:hypothetical protein